MSGAGPQQNGQKIAVNRCVRGINLNSPMGGKKGTGPGLGWASSASSFGHCCSSVTVINCTQQHISFISAAQERQREREGDIR